MRPESLMRLEACCSVRSQLKGPHKTSPSPGGRIKEVGPAGLDPRKGGVDKGSRAPLTEGGTMASTPPQCSGAREKLLDDMICRVEEYGNALWAHPIERHKIKSLLQEAYAMHDAPFNEEVAAK